LALAATGAQSVAISLLYFSAFGDLNSPETSLTAGLATTILPQL
jgi:hypothetical protein